MRALRLKPAQSSSESPKIIQLMATAKADRDRVCWWNLENYSNGNDGILRNLGTGTYLVVAVVTYLCTSNNFSIGLIKGSTTVTRPYCINSESYSTSTLTCTMRIGDGEELSAQYEKHKLPDTDSSRRIALYHQGLQVARVTRNWQHQPLHPYFFFTYFRYCT